MATPTNVHYSRPTVGPIAGGRSVFGAPAAAQAGASASLAISKAMAAAATGVMLVTGNVAHSVPLAASAQAVAAAAAALTTSGGGTYLATQAAALLPGRWVELTGMSGFNWALIASPNGSGSSVLDFANHGMDDEPGLRLSAYLGAHPGVASIIDYDEAANAWSVGSLPFGGTDPHGWASSAANPTTGHQYIYQKSTSQYWRRLSGASTFAQIATDSALSNEETNALTWDMARNGLISFTDVAGARFWANNAGTGSWTGLGDPGVAGPYHTAAAYLEATQECFLADGTSASTRYWLLNQAGSFAGPFTAPLDVACAGSNGNLSCAERSTQRLIVINPRNNAIQTFNPLTRLWRSITPSNGQIPLSRPAGATDGFVISIKRHGVVLIVQGRGNGAAPNAYLFKPTRAPILPAVVTFSAPGSIDVAPYCENYNPATTLLSLPPGTPSTVSISGSILSSSVAQTLTNQYIQETPL